MGGSESFAATFRRNAERDPARPAVVLSHGGAEDTLTYGGLDRAARSVAAQLPCRPGDRAVLAYPTGLEFVGAFLGCLYAGVIPVPMPAPGGGRNRRDRTEGIVRDADPSVVLTGEALLPSVGEWLGGRDLAGFTVMAPETDQPEDVPPPDGGDQAPAFLQYTSGSTSDPKGVMVSQANLVHNVELMRRSHGWHRDMRFCSWLPVHHDMGLIAMVLTPLFIGATAVLMPPIDFLKRPHLWPALIDRHRAEVGSAPNFAYDLCARSVSDEQVARLDLSCWRYACNGAEPIDADTLERFAARFAAAGLRPEALLPGYGLAEATLYVSGTPADVPPTVRRVAAGALERGGLAPAREGEPAVTVVSSGVVRDLDVRIVDPGTLRPLPDGRVGEVWIRGASVARGYWRRPAETRRTFHARTADGEGAFLRTGDLAALLDGELYITGRLKETLIIHGRNLYPHDIEREAARLDPAFAGLPCAVFSVPTPREEIVLVQELRARRLTEEDLRALADLLKRSLGTLLDLRLAAVAFVRRGQIPKTTSGKIQRLRTRELFLAGALDTLYEDVAPGIRDRHRAPIVTAG